MDGGNDFSGWSTTVVGGQHHLNEAGEEGLLPPGLDLPQLSDEIYRYGEQAITQVEDPLSQCLSPEYNFVYPQQVQQSTQPSHLPSEYLRSSVNPQNITLSQPSRQMPLSVNFVPSSASLDPPGLTLSPSVSETSRKRKQLYSHASPPHSQSKSHRLGPSNTNSKSGRSPIKRQKLGAKDKAAHIKELIKSECPKFSEHFFKVLDVLVEKEIEDGNLDAECDQMSLATSTQNPASQLSDFSKPTEASVSSISQDQTSDTREDVTMDSEQEGHVKYYCTFPNCRVPQKDCKYQHKKGCQCPLKHGRYWAKNKADFRRHEGKEDHWRQDIYVCLLCFVTDLSKDSRCLFCSMALPDDPKMHFLPCERANTNSKTFGRKDHLLGHLQKHHKSRDMGEIVKTWSLPSGTDWPKQCGFCGFIFASWDEREAHVVKDYDNGFKIQDWKLPFRRPKDRDPPGPSSSMYRKDSYDEDDDGFGGNGGNSYNKAFGKGYSAFAPRQFQQGQTYSTQGCGSSYPQNYSQSGYRAAHSLVPNGSVYDEVERQPSWALGRVTRNIALERYLKSREDRIPALGAMPRPMCQEKLHSPAADQPMQAIQLSWERSTRTITPIGRHGDKVWSSAISLHSRPVGGKTPLVRSYVSQHWQDLDRGVFWVKSKVPSEVKDSFWDIATSIVPHPSMQHAMVMMLFNSLRQSIPHTLRAPSLPGAWPMPPIALSPYISDEVSTKSVRGSVKFSDYFDEYEVTFSQPALMPSYYQRRTEHRRLIKLASPARNYPLSNDEGHTFRKTVLYDSKDAAKFADSDLFIDPLPQKSILGPAKKASEGQRFLPNDKAEQVIEVTTQ